MIGLIFGETNFPIEILKKIKKNKKKYIIIDLTNKNFFKKDKNSHKVSIGQFGKIISILKEKNCKKVLFAGKVNKPNFSKLKLTYLWRRLKEQNVDVDSLKERIHDVILKSLVAAEDAIPPQVNSFELFGYDILIDDNYKPWLIEVNASPAMACDNALDKNVKNQLIEDQKL